MEALELLFGAEDLPARSADMKLCDLAAASLAGIGQCKGNGIFRNVQVTVGKAGITQAESQGRSRLGKL